MLAPLLAGALLAVPLAGPWTGGPGEAEGADAQPGGGSIPLFFKWSKAHLEVVVVPPPHGPLYTGMPTGGAGMGTPLDLLGATYVRAALDALQGWRDAIARHAAEDPEEAWLRGVTWDVRVLTHVEAAALPAAIADADVVVNFDETKTIVFGTSLNLVVLQPLYLVKVPSPRPLCVAQNSLWFGYSFSYADVYNIVGHEFGHCLGLLHADVAHDVMVSEYAHWPEPATALHCPSNLDVRGLTLSFGDALGHPPAGSVVEVRKYRTYDVRPDCEPRT